MSSAATVAAEQPSLVEQGDLPNKFVYPEFAGFSGEKLLKEILHLILPIALYRTWEIFADNQAYGNECYMSVARAAAKLGRAEKTIQANLSELAAKNLLELYTGRKMVMQGERACLRTVVIKDFTGLYALAREYDQWCQDPDYVEPIRAYAVTIKDDPRLEAKLRRFNNYRRILYTQPSGPEAALMLEARWFQNFEGEVDRAEVENTRPICPKKLLKKLLKQNPETGQNESNEKAYSNSLSGDSFDSARDREMRGEAGATPNSGNASVAQDYTKQVRGYETGTHSTNESETNPVPSSHKNVPPGAGKTSESAENHPDVQRARGAMAAAGVVPGQSARHQAEELSPPPKHPLARSFVHEVAGLFGDLNEKGSKTGIERKIESFALESAADVLLCLVRAWCVARDTKAEKIRHRRPDGSANRMPLFCTMFGRFAQALGPGSKWQYTWEQMLEDIAADDRLSLWVSEHQAELAGDVSDQAETSEESPSVQPVAVGEVTVGSEIPAPEMPDEGWEQQEEAYGCADYLAGELAANNYEGVVIQVKVPKGGMHLQILVYPERGLGYRLVCEEDVAALVEMARNGTLFGDSETSDDQAAAGD